MQEVRAVQRDLGARPLRRNGTQGAAEIWRVELAKAFTNSILPTQMAN